MQNNKSERIKLFYQTHLTIAAKMKNDKLIKEITETLLSKDGQWTHKEVFEILHYRNITLTVIIFIKLLLKQGQKVVHKNVS